MKTQSLGLSSASIFSTVGGAQHQIPFTFRTAKRPKCRVSRLMKESSFARDGSLLRYIYIDGTPTSSAWLPPHHRLTWG